MKFKQFYIFLSVLILGGLHSKVAVANDSLVKQVSSGNETLEVIILGIIILVLIVLALWIFKNSTLLNDNLNIDESVGREWIHKHMKDLEANQLEALINRSSNQQQNEDNYH